MQHVRESWRREPVRIMTALVSSPSPSLRNGAVSAPVRRRRSARLVLLAVVLAVLGGVAGVVAYREATGRVSVVALARSVPFGMVIELADLRELRLPADTELATIGWGEVDDLVGQVATTDLPAGSALTSGAVAAGGPPRTGEAVVGVAVGPGRAPTTPLTARDEVLVITPDDRPPVRATVLGPGDLDSAGRMTVDLLVAEGVAVDLARATADDRAVLVLVAGR